MTELQNLKCVFIIVSLLVLLLNGRVAAGCPAHVIRAVYGCIRHVVGEAGEENLIAGKDAEKLRSKCLDGSFDMSILCVQDIFNSCQNDEYKLEVLHKTVDIDHMKEVFDSTCHNIAVYENSAECIYRYHNTINQCGQSLSVDFGREEKTVHTTDRYLKLVCSFMHGITRCSELPIRRYCNSEAADLSVKFMSAFTPPVCNSGSGLSNGNCLKLILCISVLFLILKVAFNLKL